MRLGTREVRVRHTSRTPASLVVLVENFARVLVDLDLLNLETLKLPLVEHGTPLLVLPVLPIVGAREVFVHEYGYDSFSNVSALLERVRFGL